MIRYVRTSVRCLLCSTVLFGVAYPFLIWMWGIFVFPDSAIGSPVYKNKELIGLHYVGQRFSSPEWFWSRPSAVKQTPILVSGASNLSWSDPRLKTLVEGRAQSLFNSECGPVPDDLLMSSASGCDPEISVKAALFQVSRIAAVRNVSPDDLRAMIFEMEEPTIFGLFPRRVNVLRLNCRLNAQYDVKKS